MVTKNSIWHVTSYTVSWKLSRVKHEYRYKYCIKHPGFRIGSTVWPNTGSLCRMEDPNTESNVTKAEVIHTVTNPDELLRLGIVSHIPIESNEIDTSAWKEWASQLSVVSPIIMTAEGDGEYAFYRNILEEPDFPFDAILRNDNIKTALIKYFNIQSLMDDEIKLDDAFCIHYNMNQTDTSGARHIDPSDITINLCLNKSDDCLGSHVLFHGSKELHGIDNSSCVLRPEKFLVNQEMGYATMHWGDHAHETTMLEAGYRTNIILTYCYTDKTRSNVSKRSCYNV